MIKLSRREIFGNLPEAALGSAVGASFLNNEEAAAQPPAKPTTGNTLYERLGGYDGISAVVEDFSASFSRTQKSNNSFVAWGPTQRNRSSRKTNTCLPQ